MSLEMAESTMFFDVEQKLKKKNKILFSRDSQCLQELKMLIEQQEHCTLVMWALDLCEKWSRGKIKMPVAKRAILDAHAVAKEIDDKVIDGILKFRSNYDRNIF